MQRHPWQPQHRGGFASFSDPLGVKPPPTISSGNLRRKAESFAVHATMEEVEDAKQEARKWLGYGKQLQAIKWGAAGPALIGGMKGIPLALLPVPILWGASAAINKFAESKAAEYKKLRDETPSDADKSVPKAEPTSPPDFPSSDFPSLESFVNISPVMVSVSVAVLGLFGGSGVKFALLRFGPAPTSTGEEPFLTS